MPESIETEPAGPPPEPTGRSDRRRRSRSAASKLPIPPPALVGYNGRVLSLGVPALELRDVYSRTERAVFGVSRETEVRVPVLSLVF
jgi:hypothetical protein